MNSTARGSLLTLTMVVILGALSQACTVTFPEQGRSQITMTTSAHKESPSSLAYDDHPWHDR